MFFLRDFDDEDDDDDDRGFPGWVVVILVLGVVIWCFLGGPGVFKSG